MSQTITSWVK